jgi:site-specific recombinase XerD
MSFMKKRAKTVLGQISRDDLYAFIEHEQDRGLKISSVQNRVASIQVFLKFLIEAQIVNPEVLSQPIGLKVPKALPRAMAPYDVNCLLAVLDDVRNRAMILLLLRTGMRIGELLNTKVTDVHLADKKIMIFEGEKNRKGRAVCFSNDADEALQVWLHQRDTQKEYLFYAQGRYSMSYNNARVIFHRYLKRAALAYKGYTLHCLRHTFATELLNAGMRIECLQQLLGHSNLEMTLRYAKLSDTTREQEYFKAMSIIESEEFNEPDQLNRQLSPPFEAPQLLGPYS